MGSPVTCSPTVATTYTVIGTSAAGCSNTTTKNITVRSSPTITTSGGATIICQGISTTLSASGGISYAWSPSIGLATTNGATVTATPTASVTYTVTGTGFNGCTSIATRALTVNPSPTITFSSATSLCRGSSTTITAGGASTYSWSPATNLSASTGATVTFSGTATATYTVTGISATGCTGTATRTMTVNALPTITTTAGSATICNGNSTTISASGGTSYTWNPSTGLDLTTTSTVTCSTTSSTNYTVTGTDANGCSNTATRTITVPFTSVAVGLASICSGSSTTMTASGSTSYTWSPATNLSATTGTTVTTTTTANRTYTVTGVTGTCTTTATQAITVNALPTVTVTSGATTLCRGTSTTMTASGAVTYAWSPTTGLNASTDASVTASPTVTTVYTVTGTNATGCNATASLSLTVNALPTIATTVGSAAICIGASTTIGATGGTSYSWSPSTGLNVTTGANVTASPTVTTTYTVSGTNANGCVNTATRTITVNPLPTISTSIGASSICNGSSTTIGATGASTYTWTPAAGLSATTGTNVICSTTSTTTYTITGTSAAGCVNTSTLAVIVNPLPTITTGGPAAVCNGSSVSLSAAGAVNYSWTPGVSLTASTGTPVQASPTVTTTYTITGTDANGCVNTTTKAVTVNALPTITAGSTTTIVCFGSSTSLTATGGSTYSWSPTTGLSASNGTPINCIPSVTTTYTVTGTNASGCSNTATRTITVNRVSVSASLASTCPGFANTLTASGATSYTWSPATNLNATTGANVISTPTVTRTYTVTGTNGSCVTTASVTATVNGVPTVTATASPSATICAGTSTTVTASGAVSYNWTPSTGLSATTGASVICSPTTTTTYTITGTNASGCTANGTQVITVNPSPTVTVTGGTVTLCNGSSTTISSAGATSYIWSPGTGLNTTTGALVIASPTVTTVYTVTGTSAGCSASNTRTITVANVTLAVGTASVCNGSSTTISATGATNYSWSPSAGLSATTGNLVTATPTTTTTYTVTGTGTCTSNSTQLITVNPTPTITATSGSAALCTGASTTLSSTGGVSYSWSPATGLSATTGSPVTVTPSVTTTYTVTGTSAAGCSATATLAITVNGIPTATAVPGSASVCTGSSTTIQASGALTYSWSPATGLNATTGSLVTATPLTTTTYTITGTNASGCTNTSTQTITVNTVPSITLGAGSTTLCAGNSTTLSASGGTIYTWLPSTGLSATTGASVTATPAATITYTVTGISGLGCSNTATQTVTVNPLPSIVIGSGATTLCAGSSTTLSASGGVVYSWTPGADLSAIDVAVVTANPGSTTTYTVIVTDALGCSNTATRTVTVNALPVPTFTLTPGPAICTGTNVIYATQSGQTSYVWSVPGTAGVDYSITTGGIGSTNNTVTLKWLTNGDRTVAINYSNTAGCPGAASDSSTSTVTSIAAVAPITGTTVLPVGGTSTLDNATPLGSWSSSNTAVATINSSGDITGLDTGYTTISYSVTNSCGTAVATYTVQVMLRQWTGGAPGVETDWTVADNWLGGVLPDSTQDIVIPASSLFMPVVPAGGDGTARNIIVQNGGIVTVQAGGTLHVKGNLTNNGRFDDNGSVKMDAFSTQHINGNGTISNIEIANPTGVSVDSGSLIIVGSCITVSSGTFNTHDSVVLYSDEDGTARVGVISGTGSITGKIQAQQYIQGNYRRYRMWSHPFNTAISPSQLQPYMDITGSGGLGNGFTTTVTNAPSAFWYDTYRGNSAAGYDPGWKPFTSILPTAADTNKIARYQAIRLFMRGDKGEGLGGLYYTPSPNTVQMTGVINQGRQVVHMKRGTSANQDFNLLGNPYPSPVDIGTVLYNAQQTGNVTGGAFYIFNPTLGAGGNYQAINIDSAAPYYLPANAAFQVRTVHDNDTLVFNESDKAPAGSSYLFRRSEVTTTLNVYDEQNHPWDVLHIRFNEDATAAEDIKLDAQKVSFGDFSFYSLSDDNKQMAIDVRPFSDTKVIPLGITTTYLQNFIIRFDQAAVPTGKHLFLHDKMTNNYAEVALGNEYKFSITKNKQTQGSRFELTTVGPDVTVVENLKVNMLPNPATDKLAIELTGLNNTATDINVTDMLGTVVLSKHISATQQSKVELSLDRLAAGNYIVTITAGKDKVTRKLVKD